MDLVQLIVNVQLQLFGTLLLERSVFSYAAILRVQRSEVASPGGSELHGGCVSRERNSCGAVSGRHHVLLGGHWEKLDRQIHIRSIRSHRARRPNTAVQYTWLPTEQLAAAKQ